MSHDARLDKLYAMLKARTDREGKALPNYAENVAAIKAEIRKLEERLTGIALLGGGDV